GRAMAACFELVLAYATSASGPHHLGCPAILSSKSSAVRCFDHANTSYFISFFVWPISRLSNRTSRKLDGVPWQVEKRIVGDRRCYPLYQNARSPAPLLLIWKDLAKTLKTISLLYWDEAHRSLRAKNSNTHHSRLSRTRSCIDWKTIQACSTLTKQVYLRLIRL
ncbi:hypothetical protein PSTG_05596, partial [Puccinia striiformis f. sp. tritici PST-78]